MEDYIIEQIKLGYRLKNEVHEITGDPSIPARNCSKDKRYLLYSQELIADLYLPPEENEEIIARNIFHKDSYKPLKFD